MDERASLEAVDRRELARLVALDELLPALAGVLEIREVFGRVSAIARKVIPHDLISLPMLTADKKSLVIHALSDDTTQFPETVPIPDQHRHLVSSPWDYIISGDIQADPLERLTPPGQAGYHARLAVPIRLQGELVGAIDFLSRNTDVYATSDVLVARRIADHVALVLSHQRLAEEARRIEELRTREARLELLDERLAALTDSGELTAAFARVSEIARQVLPHDALVLPVLLPDGIHARAYAYTGLGSPAASPEVVKVPDAILRGERDHELVNDLAASPEPYDRGAAAMGHRSALRVTIRLEGRLAGGVVFLSRRPAAFNAADILIARRIADRLALSLSRERAYDAIRRADEAAERAARLESRVQALTEELNARAGFNRIVGKSTAWRRALAQATQVAATETTVLLLGESGTGKEVVARFVHRASPRSGGPFVALNCAALPEPLLESELFGFERGAFTGAQQAKPGQIEQAAGGVLFLDEVAEMSPSAQAKFLRVLQEREFQRLGSTRTLNANIRVVAATNRNLRAAMEAGTFREDLYYRLGVFEIRLPPLRERRDDILLLSEAFLEDLGKSFGRPPGGISHEARDGLLAYDWPGNVRELRNMLERAAILCEGGLITTDHLTVPTSSGKELASRGTTEPGVERGGRIFASEGTSNLRAVERATIERALVDARYNKSQAAKQLGLSRKQLYARLRQHGLE
jgi:transcriptional regulator with GAF, ATPase, and Fis domain